MTEGTGARDAPRPFTDEEPARGHNLFGMGEPERQAVLDWVGENLTQVRRSVYEQRLLHWSLGTGSVVGLATHVGGYALRSSVTTEPLVLMADLFYALGYAPWTGVVVVVFVQVFPEAKRRQFKQALDAYEAAQREQVRAGTVQASGRTQRRQRGPLLAPHLPTGHLSQDRRGEDQSPSPVRRSRRRSIQGWRPRRSCSRRSAPPPPRRRGGSDPLPSGPGASRCPSSSRTSPSTPGH
jgi:hypothetical protein